MTNGTKDWLKIISLVVVITVGSLSVHSVVFVPLAGANLRGDFQELLDRQLSVFIERIERVERNQQSFMSVSDRVWLRAVLDGMDKRLERIETRLERHD